MAYYEIDRASKVVASEDQVSCRLDGEAALLQMSEGVYYGLDELGARIWDEMQEPITIEELRDRIVREYDVDVDRAERDLIEFCEKMISAGLVRVTR